MSITFHLTESGKERPITARTVGQDVSYDWHEGEHKYRMFLDKAATGKHHYDWSFGTVRPDDTVDTTTMHNDVNASNVMHTVMGAIRHHLKNHVAKDPMASEATYHYSAIGDKDKPGQKHQDSKRNHLYVRTFERMSKPGTFQHDYFKYAGAVGTVHQKHDHTALHIAFPQSIAASLKHVDP